MVLSKKIKVPLLKKYCTQGTAVYAAETQGVEPQKRRKHNKSVWDVIIRRIETISRINVTSNEQIL